MVGKLKMWIEIFKEIANQNKLITAFEAIAITICMIILVILYIPKEESEEVKNFPKEEIEAAFYNTVKEEIPDAKEYESITCNPKLLKMYATFNEIKFAGGEKIPTLYKYTKYDYATNYIHTKESNIAAEDSTIIKLYYDNLDQENIDLYKKGLEKNEGYTKMEEFPEKTLYVKEGENNQYYTYIIIQADSITYGSKGGEYSKK